MKNILLKTFALTLVFIFTLSTSVFASNLGLVRESTPTVGANSPYLRQVSPIDLNTLPYVLGDGYIEFTIPADLFTESSATPMSSSVFGNVGTLTANIPRGSLGALSHTVRLNSNVNLVPMGARVTNINVSFQVATDPWSGVTGHDIFVTHRENLNSGGWQAILPARPNVINQSINSTWLNNLPARAFWDINMHARRVIVPGNDNGAVAILRNVTLRIDFR